jgi:hypothetical protein
MFLRNIGRISMNYTALYLRKKSISNIYARYARAFITCLLILPNLKILLTVSSTYAVHDAELIFCGLCTEKQNKAIQHKRLGPSSSILRHAV